MSKFGDLLLTQKEWNHTVPLRGGAGAVQNGLLLARAVLGVVMPVPHHALHAAVCLHDGQQQQ